MWNMMMHGGNVEWLLVAIFRWQRALLWHFLTELSLLRRLLISEASTLRPWCPKSIYLIRIVSLRLLQWHHWLGTLWITLSWLHRPIIYHLLLLFTWEEIVMLGRLLLLLL